MFNNAFWIIKIILLSTYDPIEKNIRYQGTHPNGQILNADVVQLLSYARWTHNVNLLVLVESWVLQVGGGQICRSWIKCPLMTFQVKI